MAILLSWMTSNLSTLDNMKLNEYILKIEEFLKNYLENSGMNTYVLGVSGGVDSSLTAALIKNAVGKEKLMCVLMPIDSNPSDLKDGLYLIKELDLDYAVIDASKTYQSYLEDLKAQGIELGRDTKSNLKARIRMSILYAYAQEHRGLVVGTDNKDERYTGYFTKFGDGACDLLPICHLLKCEVVEASKMLGIPTRLAERVPTAGLFEGQTDEGEMGVTYKDLDAFLRGEKVSEEAEKRILHLHRISNHKRDDIPCPEDFNRD